MSMSEFQKESDWWEGADGKWYPPVAKKTEADPVVEPEVLATTSKEKKSRVRLLLSCFAAIVLLAVGIFVYQESKPEFAYTRLSFQLIDTSRNSGGWSVLPDCKNKTSPGVCSCVLSAGYGDLNDSTSVIVFGASGNELGRSELGPAWFFHLGVARAMRGLSEYDSKKGRSCYWSPESFRLPDNEKYYVVKIGNRNEVKLDFEDLTTNKARALTIEDD